MIKPYISGLLRRVGLLGGTEWLRFWITRTRFNRSNKRFLKNHPDVEIPPDFFLYETYMLNYELYYFDGLETAGELINLLRKHYDVSRSGTRFLDWGCGPARITRHLPDLLPVAEIYGMDFNERYVSWCRSKIGRVNFEHTKVSPPTTYPDNMMDIVIGLSVFTHLSAQNHLAWLDELYRCIKPGGLLLITTQGLSYLRKLSTGEKEKFKKGNLIVRGKVLEGNRLYSAFQPESFVKSIIKNKFEIIEFIPGMENSNDPEQDKWILKKIK
ncbi:MAG TPA: class I SAM-dependent methyltransferase [Agriterribacter sp.]|nr:class I SAM-dependent methyltransferase [Chitinophagaceae bacterium]HRP30519.1 class I SAM-dependent methyltransferase [Agriterribacter sp.]